MPQKRSICAVGLALILSAGVARADVIHLKNGRTISAENVREQGTRLEYDIGEDTYAIPMSSVERVEKSSDSSSEQRAKPQLEVPQPELKDTGKLAQVPEHEKLTPEAIETIAKYNNPKLTASALLQLAHDEQTQGKLELAQEYLERAMQLVPDEPAIVTHYVSVLLQSQQSQLAQRYAEDSVRLAPDVAITHRLLGLAYFKNNETPRAITEWKRAQEIEPDAATAKYLALATREEKAEADFRQELSQHFALRYEGTKVSETLRRDVLDTLERHFNDLVRDLNLYPRDTIAVVLYTNQAYFDVTQAPSWTGAVNDGKIRIPVEGLTKVSPELSRVLKHELAHSFINQESRGHCPQWLNEGLAQALEPRSLGAQGRALATSYAAGQQQTLKSLEGSFMRFSPQQATLAYAQSLAVVQYIRDYYGMYTLVDILKHLGEGESTEDAMRAVIHSDYAQLERDFSDRLLRQGGD